MKAFLLDNNVVSELWKPSPSPKVEAFVQKAEWFVPAVVIAEIQEGAEANPSATRRAEINARLDEFLQQHSALVVSWDSGTARAWGRLKHSPEVKRQPQALWDSLIDAMAVQFGFTVATRNKGDFRHADTFDPFSEELSLEPPT